MRGFLRLFLAGSLALGFCGVFLADARSDLRIKTKTDEKRYTVYKLVNTGEKTVRVKIELEKRCSSVSNNQKPKVQEYWISPRSTIDLARVWPQSTCKRTYRIIEADYPNE